MTILLNSNISKTELKTILKTVDTRTEANLKINGLLFPARRIKNLVKTFKNDNDFSFTVKEDCIFFSWMNGSMNFKPLEG